MLDIIKWSLICTTFSVVFIAISLFVYFLLRKRIGNFFINLGVYLLICDLPMLLSSYYIYTDTDSISDTSCNVLGVLREFSSVSCMFWNSLMMWTVYKTIRYNLDESYLVSKKFLFMLIGYGVPLTLSIIPIFFHEYKSYFIYCWIDVTPGVFSQEVLFTLAFAVPLLVSLFLSFMYYIRTFLYMRQFDIEEISGEFYALSLFPIVLMTCNTASIIDRMYDTYIDSDGVEWLGYLHVIMRQSQAFFNCLVFLLNPKVLYEIKRKCTRRNRAADIDSESVDSAENLDSDEESDSGGGNVYFREPPEGAEMQKLHKKRFNESYKKLSKMFDIRKSFTNQSTDDQPFGVN